MFLDTKSLLIVFVLTHAMQAAGLGYVRHVHNNYPPALFWALGSTSFVVGVLVGVLIDLIPEGLAVVSGQFFIGTGLMLLNGGIVMACGQKLSWRISAGVLAILVAFGAWIEVISPDVALRPWFLVACFLTWNGYSILTILRHPRTQQKSTLLILALLQAIEIVTQIVRAVWLNMMGIAPTFQNNPVETASLLAMIGTTFMTAFMLSTFTSQRLLLEHRHAARHDELTGLYNRRAFAELAEREWQRTLRHQGVIATLMIDIDFFKALNDRFGHLIGDAILVVAARTIADNLRAEDILCRFGGEEFTVLLADTDAEQAMVMAERLRAAVAALKPSSIQDFPLSISLGIAVRTDDNTGWENLVNQADLALYQAKHQGRNRVCLYAE